MQKRVCGQVNWKNLEQTQEDVLIQALLGGLFFYYEWISKSGIEFSFSPFILVFPKVFLKERWDYTVRSFLYFVLWFYFGGTHQEESHVMCCYVLYLLHLPCCVHVFRELFFHDPPLVFNASHKQSSCWFNIWINVEAEVNLAVFLCRWWVVCSKRNGASVQEVS